VLHPRLRPATLWLTILAWTAGWGLARATPSGISWHFFVDGVRGLGADGLHLYAAQPQLQIGPLAFAVAAPLQALPASVGLIVAQVLMTAALPLALAVIAPLVTGPHRATRLLATALVLAPTWTVLSVRWAHLDDALALVLLCLALRACRDGRVVLGGLAVGLAVDAKPWALVGIPLLLLLPRPRNGFAVAIATTVAAWAPFVVADPSTLTALHPRVGISDSSVLRLLGVRGTVVPGWDRTAQLLLAPLVALITAVRGRWPAALLAGIAVRLVLDPQDLAYYAAGAVLAAALVDLLLTRTRLPWATLSASVVFWQPFTPDFAHRLTTTHGLALWWFEHPQQIAAAHLVWAVLVVAAALAWPARAIRHRPSDPDPDLDVDATYLVPPVASTTRQHRSAPASRGAGSSSWPAPRRTSPASHPSRPGRWPSPRSSAPLSP
jgi:hypothetical protein